MRKMIRRRAAQAALATMAVLLAGAATSTRSEAAEYAYCAVSGGHEEQYVNCGFATLEQCLEELKGLRGHCMPNPHYAEPPSAPAKPKPARPRAS